MIADICYNHFSELLSVRHGSLIGVYCIKGIFDDEQHCYIFVTCGPNFPFISIEFGDTIAIKTGWPRPFYIDEKSPSIYSARIVRFSKGRKLRALQDDLIKRTLMNNPLTEIMKNSWPTFTHHIDYAWPDAINCAEFYIQNIITRVKYSLSNKCGFYIPKPKCYALMNLIDLATIDYKKSLK